MANRSESLHTNVTEASALAGVIPSGPSVLTTILIAISAWIVFANTLILMLLVVSRKALENFVNLQIMSFSVTDTLVGLAAIPTALTYKLNFTLTDVGPCALVLCSYSVTQAATLYHAFVICVHRLITIKRCAGRSESNRRHMYKTLLIQVSIPWVESLLVVSVLFALFAKFGKTLPICSLNTLFEEDYIHVMTFLCINLLTPQIGMNVVYIYMLVFLLRQWKRVSILRGNARPTATTSYGVWNTTQAASIEETKPTIPTAVGKSSIHTKESFRRNDNDEKNTKANVNKRQKIGEKDDSNDKPITKTWKNVSYNDNAGNQANDTNDQAQKSKIRHFQKAENKDRKLGVSGQRDVIITIGLLLIILNVFMTPLTFLAIVESLNAQLLSRQVKFIIMILALMNSAINPFVYIARIKPFRHAVVDLWTKIWANVCKENCRH